MASAQVLPTKKQEHLEAGKRRLEEFRKKKAAEKAKKASSSSLVNGSEVSSNEIQPAETVRVTVSDGAGTSDGPAGGFTEASSVISSNGGNAIDFSQKMEHASSNNAYSSHSTDNYNGFSADQGYKRYGVSDFPRPSDVGNSYDIKGMNNDVEKDTGTVGALPYVSTSDHPITLRPQANQESESNTSQFSFFGDQSSEHKLSLRDSGSGYSQQSVAKISPQNSVSTFLQSETSNFRTMAGGPPSSSSLYQDLIEPSTSARGFAQEVGKSIRGGSGDVSDPLSFRFGEGKLSSSANGLFSFQSAQVQTSESTGYGYDARSLSNHVQPVSVTPDTSSRRSRPSFLDSLNASGASSGSPFQQAQPESYFSSSSKSNGTSILGSLPFHKPSMEDGPVTPYSFEHSNKSSLSPSAGVDQQRPIVENSLDRKHEFYSSRQNDDFTALEQHIEDLTQEKFSLQRALEASRSLAESLASENSSLTETYNQQRSVVDQLKSDLETLQEEIKAHMVELEAVRNEYANAQLECNAADERSKLLASEVIGLEEKALRLRSSELKLERQLENSQAEISSYKKRLSSLEKDRSDLHSTINALQEEKKLLQSMLRKVSANEKKADVSKSTTDKKDVFTSTEDLETNEEVSLDTVDQRMRDASGFPMLPENGQSSFDVSSVNIPPDQMRTIENINTLVSELTLEKEELLQSLASETSQCSKLKELNTELSRKLEAQTQRLELLTAQSMANESTPVRQPISHDLPDSTPYADEGDEVVERVLGWIMKLFPGGPSRRRTSAQWTGIVTTIAIEMLKSGMVEAVIYVQSDPEDRFSPMPVLARTPEEVLAAKGVKPTLSPNLNKFSLVEAAGVKKLLICGVGCQVQALRSVEHHLNLEKLYVLGTNCVDNGTREGLDKFLKAASSEPETVLHYEFMQDYKVHLKHLDGHIEEVPYFSLPANDLTDVIAPSCYSCFGCTNGLVDLVVGYMGVPKYSGISMTQHPQYVTVRVLFFPCHPWNGRNERGREMISLLEKHLEITPTTSTVNP